MEKFKFSQVKLSTIYKKFTYKTGEVINKPEQGTIMATYTVDGIDHSTKVASYRTGWDSTSFALYNDSGVTLDNIEPFLYDIITKSLNRDMELYPDNLKNSLFSLNWLRISLITHKWKIEKENEMNKGERLPGEKNSN